MKTLADILKKTTEINNLAGQFHFSNLRIYYPSEDDIFYLDDDTKYTCSEDLFPLILLVEEKPAEGVKPRTTHLLAAKLIDLLECEVIVTRLKSLDTSVSQAYLEHAALINDFLAIQLLFEEQDLTKIKLTGFLENEVPYDVNLLKETHTTNLQLADAIIQEYQSADIAKQSSFQASPNSPLFSESQKKFKPSEQSDDLAKTVALINQLSEIGLLSELINQLPMHVTEILKDAINHLNKKTP